MSEIVLYDYWRSSASYRLRIVLKLAGLEWDTEIINLLNSEQTKPTHVAKNPQGLVPALEVDGELFTQSLATIEYLNETRGLNLLPTDPVARAKVRALAYAIAMEIHPVCNLRVAKHAVAASSGSIAMESWIQHFTNLGLVAVENMIKGGDYCIGNRVTLADICLVPQIYNAKRWGVDLSAVPKIRHVAAHLETLAAFQAATPENSPH